MIKIINKENIDDIIDVDLKTIYLTITEHIDSYRGYVNFPILNGGIFNDSYRIDLCINSKNGIICICNATSNNLEEIITNQDMVYNLFETSLRKNPLMIERRKLISDIIICSYAKDVPDNNVCLSGDNLIFNNLSQLNIIIDEIKQHDAVSLEKMKKVNSGIQGAYGTIVRTKRDFVIGTKSEIVSKLNDCIEEYDDSQFKSYFF